MAHEFVEVKDQWKVPLTPTKGSETKGHWMIILIILFFFLFVLWDWKKVMRMIKFEIVRFVCANRCAFLCVNDRRTVGGWDRCMCVPICVSICESSCVHVCVCVCVFVFVCTRSLFFCQHVFTEKYWNIGCCTENSTVTMKNQYNKSRNSWQRGWHVWCDVMSTVVQSKLAVATS